MRTKMTVADEVAMSIVMLLMLVKPQDSTAASTTDEHLLSRDLHVDITVSPPAPQLMLVGTRMKISVIVTSADNSTCDGLACDAPDMMMSASSHRPMTVEVETARRPLSPNATNDTLAGLYLRLNDSVVFVVDALSVGRAVVVLEIFTASADLDMRQKIAMNVDEAVDVRYTAVQDEVESSANATSTHSVSANADDGRQLVSRSSPSRLLAVIEYHITVSRHRRPIDDGFFWTVAAATLLNAFGLGCVTVCKDVKQELRKLRPSVLATLLCQFVVLPPVCQFLESKLYNYY